MKLEGNLCDFKAGPLQESRETKLIRFDHGTQLADA